MKYVKRYWDGLPIKCKWFHRKDLKVIERKKDFYFGSSGSWWSDVIECSKCDTQYECCGHEA